MAFKLRRISLGVSFDLLLEMAGVWLDIANLPVITQRGHNPPFYIFCAFYRNLHASGIRKPLENEC
jgi:hypothetical protein